MRVALALPLVLAACAPAVSPPSRPAGRPTPAPQALPTTNRYAITTPEGRLVVRLLDETPQHRDNFKRLVQQGFYDGTWFHRIIAGFVVQGGDPNTRDSTLGPAGEGGPGYTVPAEIGAYHVKGALAAAREGDDVNPQRASSGSQFYFVVGRLQTDASLDAARQRIVRTTGNPSFAWPDSVRALYTSRGGTPQLDGQYTVFGMLEEGFDVLDRLAAAETIRSRTGNGSAPDADRPLQRLVISVRPLDR
ncbi:MAG: peptidylprolyl isomerase [Bacteroidetes bacterium]|nr:peptidylprolyl isomerase [Bacteroidota bacterium]